MHMAKRRGRYHARIAAPKDLRAVIGKTELCKPLGGDCRHALRLLPGAVAQLQHEIAAAERKIATTPPGSRPADARWHRIRSPGRTINLASPSMTSFGTIIGRSWNSASSTS